MQKKEFHPLVSIVIPVYNGENYMREAIDSALAQTYDNIEVIVVDDGSKDNTEEIAKSYGNKIRYFKKENGGVSTALNYGIDKMKGEYFSWLSHDDLYKPDKVQVQIDILNKLDNKNVVIFHDYELINQDNEYLYKVVMDHDKLSKHKYKAVLEGCLNGITMLIPKEAFKVCGGFNPKFRCTQDYDMWNRLVYKYDFVHSTKIITQTRLHEGQDSNTSPSAMLEGNNLWYNLATTTPDDVIEKEYGSKLNFYKEFSAFLAQTPYSIANVKILNLLKEEQKKYDSMTDNDVTLVSVVIYEDDEKLTKDVVKRVLRQTYKNVELVFVNTKLKKDILSLLHNVKYVELNNVRKISDIAKKVNGLYVTFCSSKSLYAPDKVEEQFNSMDLSNNLISLCDRSNKNYAMDLRYRNFLSLYEKIKNFSLDTLMVKSDIISKIDVSIPFERSYDNYVTLLKLFTKYDVFYLNKLLFDESGKMGHLSGLDSDSLMKLFVYAYNNKDELEGELPFIVYDLNQYYKMEKCDYSVYGELDNIYNSRSWKVTKPLRKVLRFLRNIRGR